MSALYLHEHPEFGELLKIIEGETDIQIQLIEKDYWIMHVLYGLKKQGYQFELKGGTSLSKAYKIINRFSEDIDIHIKPPTNMNVIENPKNSKPKSIESRKEFYDWLADDINIHGVISVVRDTTFDDKVQYRSGGIRLFFDDLTGNLKGIKEGILLEAGFDTVTPNNLITISSWAFDKAYTMLGNEIKDNRAVGIACYHPGYTFVEKLQTVVTKYRQEQAGGEAKPNLMRQYYDLHSLLGNAEVQAFIGSEEYFQHKEARFSTADKLIPIAENEAFLLNDPDKRSEFKQRYVGTASLYYNGQPEFELLLTTIKDNIERL